MAKQTIVTFVDDIDGSEAKGTVVFSFEGKAYEIDLSAEHDTQLREALAPFIEAARKLTGSGRTRNINTAASYGKVTHRPTLAEQRTKDETDKIREWARANGHKVADRGRLSVVVLEAYAKRDQGEAEKIDDQLRDAEDTVKNTPPLATEQGQQDAERAADELLSGKAKPAAIAAPTVVADPFKPVRNGKASLRRQHPRSECEDLDACPHHGEVTPISRGNKGNKAEPMTVGEVDAIVMSWVRDNSTRPIKLSRVKPTTAEYTKYYNAHPEAKRA